MARRPHRTGAHGGKAAAEGVNPTVEDTYWRENFEQEPYYQSGSSFDDYAPAYRLGYEAPNHYGNKPFDDVESDLERDYNSQRGASRLEWDQARPATRAAWERVNRA